MSGAFTPGPWVVNSYCYPHGVEGDVFAKDAKGVLDATPICRVCAPISFNAKRAKGPPLDALQAIAERSRQTPTIEANARLISTAPELLSELSDLVDWMVENQRSIEGEYSMDELLRGPRAAVAKARGEAAA
jgi:hypothetical protein